MLKKLIDNFMNDQWINSKRDIGFCAAKEELLSNATIMFREAGTFTPKNVFQDQDGLVCWPNPVMADNTGNFPDIYLEGDYSLEVYDKKGVCLVMETTRPDFDITA